MTYIRTEEHNRLMSEIMKKSLVHRSAISNDEYRKKKRQEALRIGSKPPLCVGKDNWNYRRMGRAHPNWNGGSIKILSQIRNQYEYRQWRADVFKKDKFTCQECGIIKCNLESHHIKALSVIVKENKVKNIDHAIACAEIWNINNGVTLCIECHKKTDNYFSKAREKRIFREAPVVNQIEHSARTLADDTTISEKYSIVTEPKMDTSAN